MSEQEKEESPRVFAGPGFVMQLEPGLYGIFRSVMTEERDPKTGKMVREKMGRNIGPLGLLREAKEGEDNLVVIRTIHPETQNEIKLVEYKEGDKL
jgi:hypothetical protein